MLRSHDESGYPLSTRMLATQYASFSSAASEGRCLELIYPRWGDGVRATQSGACTGSVLFFAETCTPVKWSRRNKRQHIFRITVPQKVRHDLRPHASYSATRSRRWGGGGRLEKTISRLPIRTCPRAMNDVGLLYELQKRSRC